MDRCLWNFCFNIDLLRNSLAEALEAVCVACGSVLAAVARADVQGKPAPFSAKARIGWEKGG